MAERDLITMSRLGSLGRWGNQVFEYAFLRTYAKRYGLEYQCRPWIGQRLMGYTDPPITMQLPKMDERREPHEIKEPSGRVVGTHPHLGLSYPPEGDEARGHDFEGYCQFHTDYYLPDRDFIQSLFVPTEEIHRRMQPATQELRKLGSTRIGVHLRRGDTGRFVYYLTPNEWYLQWLEEHWGRFTDPVLFVASEEPDDYKAFAKYKPITSRMLMRLDPDPYAIYNYLREERQHPTPLNMDWFPDWYLLCHCDVLVFGNSTFSFTAGWVNPHLQEAWRSRLSTQRFEKIDLWSEWPLLREDLRQYAGIPGTVRRATEPVGR
jgi:hypothetical protein